MTKKELRAKLVERYGEGNVRFRRDGMVLVNGTIPNTNQEGWYNFGWVEEVIAEELREV